MLSRILVAGVLAGSAAGGFIGQTTPAPFDWASLVGGAVGSSPAAIVLAWQLTKRDKENAAMRDEIRELHTESRATTERVATVLAETSRTLASVHEGMEATLDRGVPSRDLEQVVRRLEGALRDVQRGRDEQERHDDRRR